MSPCGLCGDPVVGKLPYCKRCAEKLMPNYIVAERSNPKQSKAVERALKYRRAPTHEEVYLVY